MAGENGLEMLKLESGEKSDAQSLFVARGEAESSDFAYGTGLFRNGQFIEIDRKQHINVPGVFAAGDREGRFLQVSVAALVGRVAISHIKKRRRALLDKKTK